MVASYSHTYGVVYDETIALIPIFKTMLVNLSTKVLSIL